MSFLLGLILLVALGGWLDARLPWPISRRQVANQPRAEVA